MSKAINTLLFATDLSDSSRPVFEMALKLAKQFEAKLVIMHVIEPLNATAASAVNVYMPSVTVDEFYQKSVDEMHKSVEEKMTQLYRDEVREQLGDDDLTAFVLDGVPAPTIIKTADKMNADMIVLGSHTHNTFENIFIGSVANKVLDRSARPVLLVPIGRD